MHPMSTGTPGIQLWVPSTLTSSDTIMPYCLLAFYPVYCRHRDSSFTFRLRGTGLTRAPPLCLEVDIQTLGVS